MPIQNQPIKVLLIEDTSEVNEAKKYCKHSCWIC